MTATVAPADPVLSDLDRELDRLMEGLSPIGTATVIARVLEHRKPHVLTILDNLGIRPMDLGPGTAYRYRLREAFRAILTAPSVSLEKRQARTRAATTSRLGKLAQQSPENRELRARAVAAAAAKKRRAKPAASSRTTSASAATV